MRRTSSNGDERVISRRQLLAEGALLTLGVSGCTQQSRPDPNVLNIYSWADYLHPSTIPNFEKRYNVRVVYDTFASNESLLAKLQAGANQYDIVVPTSYMVTQFIKLSLLSELDHARLPNLRNIMPRFRDPAFDRKLKHSIPYTWGTTGIGYNIARMADPERYPDDLDAFWDPRYAQRMTLLDDARETIGMALKRRGLSYNLQEKDKIELAVADLKAQKPLTMCYTSDQVIVQLASGDSWLSLVYSGDAYQAARDCKDVRYVIPHSGASLWLDNMCVPKTAPHPDNAYKWINFMLEPEVAAATANYTRYATPNQKALALIDSNMKQDPNLYPPESLMDKCEEIGDIGSLLFFYDRMWTELKCS